MRPLMRPERALRPLVSALGACLVWAVAAAPLAVADEPAEELQASLEERFELLPLRDGLMLRPRGPEAGWRSLEVRGSSLALDGAEIALEDLGEALGDDSRRVEPLLELTPREQRNLALRALGVPLVERERRVHVQVDHPAPPAPPAPPRSPKVSPEKRVVMGSRLEVGPDEVTQDVVVMGGSARIDGEVWGDLVVLGGSAVVHGKVTGDAAVIGGSLELGPTAHVAGDVVVVGGNLRRDPEASIGGDVVNMAWQAGGVGRALLGPGLQIGVPREPTRRAMRLVGSLFFVAILVLLSWFVALIARRPLERVGVRLRTSPLVAGLTGFGVQVLFLPMLIALSVALAISVIGAPLIVLLWPLALLALAVALLLGYAGAAYGVARWSEGRFGWRVASPYLAILVGIALIQAWAIIGHFLGIFGTPLRPLALVILAIGLLIQYLAWTVGLGAVVLSGFGSSAPAGAPPAAPASGAAAGGAATA